MKTLTFRFVKPVLAVAILASVTQSALAADKELLDILLGNGALTQQQYDELLAKQELEKADIASLSFGKGSGLKVASGDGKYEMEIGGRLHLDYTDHSYDSLMGLAPISGTQIRRGRVEFDGFFDKNWAWAAEFDFAKNGTAIKDFKIGYKAENGAEFYVGHQKQPYSLSLEMSSNDEPFVERGVDNFLVAAFTDRAIGARAEWQGEHWFAAGGLFGETLKTGGPGDEGWGSSGRFVYAPVIAENKVVHLGYHATWREIDASSPVVSIKDKTTDFSDLSIVNTGNLTNAESVTMTGPEFAVSYGPLFVFGEYSQADIERRAASTLNFDSWHVAATFALTGESYATRYRLDEGEFKNIRAKRTFSMKDGGWGAWEVGARFASIDLNDGNIVGGEEDVVSLTLNWYLNNNMRMMADWSRVVDTDESNTIRRFAPDMDIFTLRSQWNF